MHRIAPRPVGPRAPRAVFSLGTALCELLRDANSMRPEVVQKTIRARWGRGCARSRADPLRSARSDASGSPFVVDASPGGPVPRPGPFVAGAPQGRLWLFL